MTNTQKKAALYLRSSKDRSDVSIDAQRRKLMELAQEKDFLVIHEFVDVVESAKSENRPGFQTMLRDIKSPSRQWTVLLILDHSRLSRQQYVGPIFAHEAQRKGIEVVYAMMPDLDPINRILMDSVLDAFSVVHSLMSKEKGLAGMAENVQQGFRAGGKAPRGYQLEYIDTRVIRDGEPVLKSRLIPNEDAPLIARYLEARAVGVPRAQAIKMLNLPWKASSLVDLEWNALTYAGHTVWNVRAEKNPDGGYKGGKKRKPRSEWFIKENTHEPLISTETALQIIRMLESGTIGKAVSAAKSGNSSYLLTGVLKAPDDRDWSGDANKHYRLKAVGPVKGRWLNMNDVDEAITSKIIDDLSSPEFIQALVSMARQAQNTLENDPVKPLRQQTARINSEIRKASDLALKMIDPDPMLRNIEELEQRRKALVDEIVRLEREQQVSMTMAQVSETQVQDLLATLSENFRTLPMEDWKELIRSITDRIELDPVSLDCRIHYRIPVENTHRRCMASPRGVEPLSPP